MNRSEVELVTFRHLLNKIAELNIHRLKQSQQVNHIFSG